MANCGPFPSGDRADGQNRGGRQAGQRRLAAGGDPVLRAPGGCPCRACPDPARRPAQPTQREGQDLTSSRAGGAAAGRGRGQAAGGRQVRACRRAGEGAAGGSRPAHPAAAHALSRPRAAARAPPPAPRRPGSLCLGLPASPQGLTRWPLVGWLRALSRPLSPSQTRPQAPWPLPALAVGLGPLPSILQPCCCPLFLAGCLCLLWPSSTSPPVPQPRPGRLPACLSLLLPGGPPLTADLGRGRPGAWAADGRAGWDRQRPAPVSPSRRPQTGCFWNARTARLGMRLGSCQLSWGLRRRWGVTLFSACQPAPVWPPCRGHHPGAGLKGRPHPGCPHRCPASRASGSRACRLRALRGRSWDRPMRIAGLTTAPSLGWGALGHTAGRCESPDRGVPTPHLAQGVAGCTRSALSLEMLVALGAGRKPRGHGTMCASDSQSQTCEQGSLEGTAARPRPDGGAWICER